MCASALTDLLSVPEGSVPALHDVAHPQTSLQNPSSWAEKHPTNLFLFYVFPLDVSDASFGVEDSYTEWE